MNVGDIYRALGPRISLLQPRKTEKLWPSGLSTDKKPTRQVTRLNPRAAKSEGLINGTSDGILKSSTRGESPREETSRFNTIRQIPDHALSIQDISFNQQSPPMKQSSISKDKMKNIRVPYWMRPDFGSSSHKKSSVLNSKSKQNHKKAQKSSHKKKKPENLSVSCSSVKKSSPEKALRESISQASVAELYYHGTPLDQSFHRSLMKEIRFSVEASLRKEERSPDQRLSSNSLGKAKSLRSRHDYLSNRLSGELTIADRCPEPSSSSFLPLKQSLQSFLYPVGGMRTLSRDRKEAYIFKRRLEKSYGEIHQKKRPPRSLLRRPPK